MRSPQKQQGPHSISGIDFLFSSLTSSDIFAPQTFIHGFVRQAVGFPVVFAQGVADGEPVQLGDQISCASMEVFQRGVLDFVNPFDLADQKFGVADHAKGFRSVLDGVLKRSDQPLVLSEVVGLVAEILAESGDLASGFVLNDDAISCRARIAACAAVDVSIQIKLGRNLKSPVLRERSESMIEFTTPPSVPLYGLKNIRSHPEGPRFLQRAEGSHSNRSLGILMPC